MSSIAELASSFGIPVAAASIAGSIYAALSKAETVARPEALREISAVLKAPSWSRSVKPWSVVERLFVWTFGERHFSVKCIKRSAASTIIMVASLLLINLTLTGKDRLLEVWPFLAISPISSFVPDYIALLKTRVILRAKHGMSSVFILCVDIAGSITISTIFITISGPLIRRPSHFADIIDLDQFFSDMKYLWNPVVEFHELTSAGGFLDFSLYTLIAAFYFSTLFTSVWLVLIVLSSAFLKLLAPLHRFTAWFFDVEKHPLEAVGIVAGALVMVGAAIWTIVQKS